MNSRLFQRFCGAAVLAAGALVVSSLGTEPAWGQEYFTSPAQVYIDDDAAAQVEVDEIEAMIRGGREREAAARLQRLVEREGEALVQLSDAPEVGVDPLHEEERLYAEVGSWAARMLREHDAVRAAYVAAEGLAADTAAREARELAWEERGGALEEVRRRYPSTPAAERATLDLAAWRMERGDAARALTLLNSLDDDARRGERYEALFAATTAAAGDDAAFDAASATRPDPERRQLVALRQAAKQAGLLQHGSVEPNGGEALAGGVEVALDEPLWSYRWGNASTLSGARSASRGMNRQGRVVAGMLVVPRVEGNAVYLNTQDRVIAIDRWSGRELWVHDAAQPGRVSREVDENPMHVGAMVRGQVQTQGIARSVGVGGGVGGGMGDGGVYAVMGAMEGVQMMFGGAVGASGSRTWLAALDAATGEQRWGVTPAEVAEDFADARFDGTPIWEDGRVYVLVRRVRAGGFQDTMMAALDAATGEPAWHRHISSSTLTLNGAAGPAGGFIVEDGTVYVCDNVGVAAALDAADGSIRWLKVAASDRGTTNAVVRTDAVTPVPVLVEAGLIVSMMPSGANLYVLDPQTGRVRRLLGRPGDLNWPEGVRAVKVGEDVLAMSPRVARLDGETLEPRWEMLMGRDIPATDALQDGHTDAAAIGAVAVTGGGGGEIVFASPRGTVRMDWETGAIHERRPAELANVEAMGAGLGGVVMATADGEARAYIGWEAAHQGLVRAIQERPLDAMPGVSLADLAVKRDRPEAVMEGLEAAVAAMDRRLLAVPEPDPEETARGRRAVVDLMVRLSRPATGLSLEQRGRVLDTAATTVVEPEEAAAYALARGLWLEQSDRGGEAVDQYQAILLDPALAAVPHEGERVTRRAGLEARSRVEALVERLGRDVYAPHEAEAAVRLQAIQNAGADASALTSLAESYPASDAAGRALLEAAGLQAATGAAANAEAAYRDAYQLRGITPATRGSIVVALAQHHLDTGDGPAAVRWLRQVRREYPDLRIQRGDAPITLDAWIDELAEKYPAQTTGPHIGLPLSMGTRLEGTPVPLPRNDPALDSLVLTIEDGWKLRLYDLAHPNADRENALPRWSYMGKMRLMAVTRTHVFLLSEDAQPELEAIDLATGDSRWRVPLPPSMRAAAAPAMARIGDPRDRMGDAEARIADARARLEQARARALNDALARAGRNPAGGGVGLRVVVIDGEAHIVQLDGGGGNAIIRINGEVIEPHAVTPAPAPTVQTLTSDAGLCIVGPRGDALGLDPTTGEVRWRAKLPLHSVTDARVQGDLAVAWGTTAEGTPAVVAWSITSGLHSLKPLAEEDVAVSWLDITPDGTILMAVQGGVSAVQAPPLRLHNARWPSPLWTVSVDDDPIVAGWIGGDAETPPSPTEPTTAVALVAADGVVTTVDLRTGEIRGSVSLPMPEGRSPQVVQHVGGPACIVRFGGELAAISSNGKLMWRAPAGGPGTGAADDPSGVAAAVVGEDQVAILTTGWAADDTADGSVQATVLPLLQVLDANTGRILDEYALPTAPTASNAIHLHLHRGGVLLGDNDNTLFLKPTPPSTPR